MKNNPTKSFWEPFPGIILQHMLPSSRCVVFTKHRRMMELEDKEKVVTSIWRGRMCSIACRVSSFASVDLEEKDEFKRCFQFEYSTEAKQLPRQGIEQILPPKQTRPPLPCLLILSFFYERKQRSPLASGTILQ